MLKLKRFALKRKVLFVRSAALLIPVMFALLLLSQPAFAENTYVITDGSRVITYTSSATDPETVLGEAGLALGEDDTYTTQAGIGTSEITIRRSQTIYIDYYGEQIQTSSNGETVEALLTRLNISLGSNDEISHSLDDETYNGMRLTIHQVVRQEQTYSVTIAYDTTYLYDATLPEGTQFTVTQGVDGEMLCTAEVTYRNGQEISRTILSQNVTIPAVDQVIAIGTGLAAEAASEDAPVIGDSTITLPTGEVLAYTDVMTCTATAYYTRGRTATGTQARYGAIAVDPSVIPYGTRMYIVTNDGEYIYGIATAEDCGDSQHISGTRIDLWYATEWECILFGVRECTVYILGSAE